MTKFARMTFAKSLAAAALIAAAALPASAQAQRSRPAPPPNDIHVPQIHNEVHVGPYGTIVDSWWDYDPPSSRTGQYRAPSTYRNPYTNEATQNRGRACPQPYRNPYTNEAMHQRQRGQRADPYWCLREGRATRRR